MKNLLIGIIFLLSMPVFAAYNSRILEKQLKGILESNGFKNPQNIKFSSPKEFTPHLVEFLLDPVGTRNLEIVVVHFDQGMGKFNLLYERVVHAIDNQVTRVYFCEVDLVAKSKDNLTNTLLIKN